MWRAYLLEMRSAYSAWSQVFSKEYELLLHKTIKGGKADLTCFCVEHLPLLFVHENPVLRARLFYFLAK